MRVAAAPGHKISHQGRRQHREAAGRNMPEPIAYWKALLEDLWIIVGLAVLVALLVIAAWGWLCWPKRVAAQLALNDPKARADVEDNFRKTVGQLLGGAVVLLGAGLAYWQFRQQQQTSSSQFSEQQRASHDLLISNQVSKGFEQLGSEKVVIRLGGIYALEGVMNGSDQYHQPVLEALTAFVREGAKQPTTPPTVELPTTPLPTDVQAALTVIGRRSAAGLGIVDLDNTSIAGAYLNGADLRGADLRAVDLNHADLSGSDLTGADLTVARLAGADLTGASLDHANLAGANLTGANLANANLAHANLGHANLANANLPSAQAAGANLESTDLTGARLAGANLTGAILTGADLRGAALAGAKLGRADLVHANLTHADLSGADLTGANLGRTTLDGAGLAHANLGAADLTGARLAGAYLTGADLRGAVLAGAYLTGADLRGAALAGAKLDRANLTGAIRDGPKQLDAACGSDVALPTGLTLKPCPPQSSP
jgi:uncharacterized protein YjbI with pentapeptide repeats